jgi:hypothetical protein
MLVDPKFRGQPSEVIEVLEIIGTHSGLTRLGTGLYQCNHWNFNDLCRDAIYEYPGFMQCDPAYLDSEMWELIGDEWWPTARTKDSYFLKERAAAHRVPHNVNDFHKAWKPDQEYYLGSYGVCDSPEQLLSIYDFDADPRKFCISFVKIEKATQPSEYGWRWHKWGEYVGNQNPQHEYIHDEPEIDVVYTYHVYELV